MRLKELADFQFQYTILERTKMTKKALCDLVVPFRDKYALTDGQALQIVRGELSLSKIEKLMRNAEFPDDVINMKWIPVSERLPFAEYGESEDVLTVSELGVIRVLYFDGGCWCYQTGECCPHKVTHWMPLPNPPEEV